MTREHIRFNLNAECRVIPLFDGYSCIVVDDVLEDPKAVRTLALSQAYVRAPEKTYPGMWATVSDDINRAFIDFFNYRMRSIIGARRIVDSVIRYSMVTDSPNQLAPSQWQCHRDRVNLDPKRILFAASVLYLFDNPVLGGTSFYKPKKPEKDTEQMIQDGYHLPANEFTERYGVTAGYMSGNNDWFQLMKTVAPRFNRLIMYDGSIYHSGHIPNPNLLSEDPNMARLTINGFYTCTRSLNAPYS